MIDIQRDMITLQRVFFIKLFFCPVQSSERYFFEPDSEKELKPEHNPAFQPILAFDSTQNFSSCFSPQFDYSFHYIHFHMSLEKVKQFAPGASKETLFDLTTKVTRCITSLEGMVAELGEHQDNISKERRRLICSMIQQDQDVLDYLSTKTVTHNPSLAAPQEAAGI